MLIKTRHATAGTAATSQRGRFIYLFFAQVLLLTLFPYLETPGLPTVLFRLLGVSAFLACVYAVSEKRAQWITALALALPAGILNAIYALKPSPGVAVPTLMCSLLFLVFTLAFLLRAVVKAENVTHDTIYGAISVYLLMAVVWGAAYMLLETVQPSAFSMDIARHGNRGMDWSDCVFYSFVTLTTIGYGDIVPMTAQARSLSILEAVSGTLYVAVLIARFVGVYAATTSERRADAGLAQVRDQAANADD
jgi:Ion channel